MVGPSYLGTPRAAPCSLSGVLHPSGLATTLPYTRDYTHVIREGQAHRPFSATRDFEKPVAILGPTYDGPSAGAQRDRTTARCRASDAGSRPRAQGQGRRPHLQWCGVPLGTAGRPGALSGAAPVLRADPVPGSRRADPPGGIRP